MKKFLLALPNEIKKDEIILDAIDKWWKLLMSMVVSNTAAEIAIIFMKR